MSTLLLRHGERKEGRREEARRIYEESVIEQYPWGPNQKSREGGVRKGGRCANLAQIAHQKCAQLLVFRFVNHTKGAQNRRKFVNFGDFYAKCPFSNAPFLKFLTEFVLGVLSLGAQNRFFGKRGFCPLPK